MKAETPVIETDEEDVEFEQQSPHVNRVPGPWPPPPPATVVATAGHSEDYNFDYNDENIIAVHAVPEEVHSNSYDEEDDDDDDLDSIKITTSDVLFGNNDCYDNWPGNLQMQEWIEERRPAFVMASKRAEQTRIAREIVLAVRSQDPPGRFLEQDAMTEEWFCLDEADVFVELGKVLPPPPSTGTVDLADNHDPPSALAHLGMQTASIHAESFTVATDHSFYLPPPVPNHHRTGVTKHPMESAQVTQAGAPSPRLRVSCAKRKQSTLQQVGSTERQRQQSQQAVPVGLPVLHPIVPRFAAARTVPLPSLQQTCGRDCGGPSCSLPTDAKKGSSLSSSSPDTRVLLSMRQRQRRLAQAMFRHNHNQDRHVKRPKLFATATAASAPVVKNSHGSNCARSKQPTAAAASFPSSLSKSKTTKSKDLPKGVTMRPSGKWQAQVYFWGQSRYVGVFANAEEAAFAYKLVKQRLSSSLSRRGKGEQATPALEKGEAARIFDGARREAEDVIYRKAPMPSFD